MEHKDSLIAELRKVADQNKKWGWTNYRFAYLVAIIAVAGSIAATILAAVNVVPSWVTAIIASVPAAVVAVSKTFDFERKAIWQWRTTKRIEALIRKLEHENATEEEVSREFSNLDIETFDGWIRYSNLSAERESIEKN